MRQRTEWYRLPRTNEACKRYRKIYFEVRAVRRRSEANEVENYAFRSNSLPRLQFRAPIAPSIFLLFSTLFAQNAPRISLSTSLSMIDELFKTLACAPQCLDYTDTFYIPTLPWHSSRRAFLFFFFFSRESFGNFSQEGKDGMWIKKKKFPLSQKSTNPKFSLLSSSATSNVRVVCLRSRQHIHTYRYTQMRTQQQHHRQHENKQKNNNPTTPKNNTRQTSTAVTKRRTSNTLIEKQIFEPCCVLSY